MKALGLVVSDEKIFENERFQRRRCLCKKVYARSTTDDDGQRPVTIAHPEHFVLR